MAQTTGALAGAAFKLEISTDASGTTGSWVDISGYAQSVEVGAQTAITGSVQTADGDAAIVTAANKLEPVELTFNIVYTENDSEPWDKVIDQFNGADKTIAVRWSPAGGGGGDLQYSTTDTAATAAAKVPISSCTPAPPVAANNADPVMFSFSVLTPKILKAAIST